MADTGRTRAGCDGASRVARRTFLGHGIGLMLMAFGRRLWAQGTQALRYRPLSRPVLVSLADLSAPGRARRFVAEAVSLPSAANPNQQIRIAGLVVRTATGDDQPDRFRAVCAVCPHELCDVDFLADPGELPPEVIAEMKRPSNEPVYVCPCHNSTFSVTDGERLTGPAPRGLYRFRVTNVTEGAVEISEVEEDVLLFV